MRLLFSLVFFLILNHVTAQVYNPVDLDAVFTFKVRGDVDQLQDLNYEVNGLPATGYSYSSEAGILTVIKIANSDIEETAEEELCIGNIQNLKNFYKGNFIGFKQSLDKDAKITFQEISEQNDLWVADVEYEGIIEGLESTGRCRFIYTPNHTYQVLVVNFKDSDYIDYMLSYDIYQFIKIDDAYTGRNQLMECNDATDSSLSDPNYSSAYDNGYRFGQIIAPILCLLVGVLIIGGLVFLIINIQKKKRKKEQDEFDGNHRL